MRPPDSTCRWRKAALLQYRFSYVWEYQLWQALANHPRPDGCSPCPPQRRNGLVDNHYHILPHQKMKYNSPWGEDLSTWLVGSRRLATSSLGKRRTPTTRRKIIF